MLSKVDEAFALSFVVGAMFVDDFFVRFVGA